MNLYEANGLRYNNIMTFDLPSKSSAVRGTPNSLLIEITISAVGNSTLRTASRSLDCFDNYNSATCYTSFSLKPISVHLPT